MTSTTLEPLARSGSVWRRVWSPERLLRRQIGLRAYQFGLALAFLLLLQTLVVNGLLLSGALGWFLTRTTGVLTVETGSSFSLWPGVVQLRQLHLEVRDSNVHLALEVPHGRVDISLRQLLRRRFTVESLSGEHFSLRLRPKFTQLSARRLAALPPLSDPVAKAAEGGQGHLWPVRIQRISAQYDELWLSELRYRGDAEVNGGFELVPLQRLTVDPSDVALHAGSLSYGPDERVFDLERARFHAELPQSAVLELGQHWNQNVAARVELLGRVVDLGFAAALSPELEGLAGGRGELALTAGAERGQWLGDFDFDYVSPWIVYARGPWNAALGLSLSAHGAAETSSGQGPTPLLAGLRLHDAHIDRQGKQLARLERAELDAKLTHVFPFAAPETLRTRFRDLSFAHGDWAVQQSGTLALEGVRWNVARSKLRLSALTLALDPVQIRDPKTKIDDWKLSLKLDHVSCSRSLHHCTAEFVAAGDDARPVLSLLGVHGLPPGASDFLAMPDLRVYGSLDLRPERQVLSIQRAESKTIDVKGRLIRSGAGNRAAFLFQAAPLSLGVDVQPDDTSVKLFAGEGWLEKHLERLANL